jgi:acyl carrier protein
MTRAEISPIVVSALKRIAPEIDTASLDTSTNVRDQLDLDSMDFLNFVLALHDRFNVEIPETDYPQLYTVDGAVSYLAAKTSGA